MTRWNGFGRAIAFALAAAAALFAAQVLLAPLVGARATLRVFAVASAVVYLAGLGPSWRRGAAAAAAATAAGAVLLLLPTSVAHTAVAAAGVLAACRSGIVYRSRPLRALFVELLLVAGGLALAGKLVAVAGGGVLAAALAAWAFFLVQSVFFLIGGIEARPDPGPADPFERARSELLALLD
jgi:hypothetical protein